MVQLDIWCELEEDPLKTLVCSLHTRERIGPLVATNVTHIGPMNIWCEFIEEYWLKTLLCRVYRRKIKLALTSGHKCSLLVVKMYWSLKLGPMNIWCKFGKDQLKKSGYSAHTKKYFDPTVTKTGTAECQKLISI